MAFSFFGGVHPKENKHYAEERSVQAFPAPDLVVIPMSQHIGAPCKPLVKKNDIVTKGQKIGDNQGIFHISPISFTAIIPEKERRGWIKNPLKS